MHHSLVGCMAVMQIKEKKAGGAEEPAEPYIDFFILPVEDEEATAAALVRGTTLMNNININNNNDDDDMNIANA